MGAPFIMYCVPLFFHDMKRPQSDDCGLFGVPGEIRTHDPPLRRRLLYPTELLRHINGRGSRTRTGDPLLPKQVRYQLRHAPKCFIILIHKFFSVKYRGTEILTEKLQNMMKYYIIDLFCWFI